MKFYYTLIASVLFSVLTSCVETIDPADRWKPVPDAGAPARCVLIEEYTGIDCKNCPNGHARIAEIEDFYNTQANTENGIGVITVGIHIPNFGDRIENGGFITPEAAELCNNQTTAPAARINRRNGVLELDRWQSAISAEIIRTPLVKFSSLTATINNGKLSVNGTAQANAVINDAKIQIWFVEDHIIDWQLMPNGEYNDAYEHHAVYRGSLTGLEGNDIELTPAKTSEFNFSDFEIPSVCNQQNIRVIAFIETSEAGVLNAWQADAQLINE